PWASLDGSWQLSTPVPYRLMPDTEQDALIYHVGWWGTQLAGTGGAFAPPYPTVTVTHAPRATQTLQLVGDSARGEYPVDFTIALYDEARSEGTRLNSSHVKISYAVFCLKKKKK